MGGFPPGDGLALAGQAQQHERRRSLGMDEADARLGMLADGLFVSGHDFGEFLQRAVADIEMTDQGRDAVGQQPLQIGMGS